MLALHPTTRALRAPTRHASVPARAAPRVAPLAHHHRSTVAPPSFLPHAVRADQAAETVDATTLDTIAAVTAAADATHAAALAAAAADAAAAAALPPRASPLRARVLASVRDLQKGLLEREMEVSTECVEGGGVCREGRGEGRCIHMGRARRSRGAVAVV